MGPFAEKLASEAYRAPGASDEIVSPIPLWWDISKRVIPPEHFFCNVAASGLSLFAREHAKIFAL